MTLVREYQPTFVLGDGETKEFSYLFEEVSENFIKVIVKHSDDSTYTPVFSVDLDSHKVVFGESETAPLDTDIVCIYRNTPDLQDTPFRTLQGYDAKALENILSKIVAMIQELKANGFSTQILQGTPWQLDLLHPADDGASVVVDYNARILKKGLYFQIVSGNLQVSADGSSFISMPKSADITEFRCLETVLEDLTVVRKLQYKVNNVWYDAEHNAQATADEALDLAQTVQGDLSSHKLNHNNPHQTSVANLTDTQINNPTLGHVLRFNGTKWVNTSTDVHVEWGEIEGTLADQTDLQTALDAKVNKDGTSIMTAPLKFMSGSVRGAIGPYFNGVGFWKLDSQGNLTQIASISDSQFIPTTTSAIDIGNSTKKWKDLYLSGKAYVGTINNGYDISVPAYDGTMVVADFTGGTAGQLLMLDSNLKPVWGETSTYLTYPAGWTTTGTTKTFCDDIAADSSAVVGKAYLGEVTLNDMPSGIGNAEIVVEIMDGTTAANKVIKLSLSSGNVAPYAWIYTYWNGGSNTSGWQPLGGDFLPSQTGNNGKFLTTDGSTTSWATVDALPSQSGNNGKFLTTNGSTASWSDKPLVNEATPSSSLGIGYTTVNTTYTDSINIGNGAQVLANNALALGAFASAEGAQSIAIYSSDGTAHRARTTHTGNIAIGYNALAINAAYTIAIGYNAFAQSTNAIQLGTGQNASSGTMQVWTHKLLDKTSGLIPAARFADQTNASQGQVLTLDSNLDAIWSNAGGGIDYIIAKQDPSAGNGYTWYRKYKSGWVEQGGILQAQTVSAGYSASQTLTLPITMADTNFTVTFGDVGGHQAFQSATISRTTTGGTVYQMNRAGSGSTTLQFSYTVSGVAA